jgi:hypothetical protein
MDPVTIGLALATQFAPSVIKYLTNSDTAGDVAGQVIDIAKTVTGKATIGEARAVLELDPAAQLEFQKAVMAADADLSKAYLADVANARAMQVAALGQEDRFSKRFVYYLAAAWSLFAMGYFCAVTFVPLPPAGQRVADTILGVLISSVIGVMINYFYGSTKGSQLKTQLMAGKR